MKPEIPSGRFEERDADRLIQNYGVKPPAEKRQQIEQMLRGQKEKFLQAEREREAKTKARSGRDL